MAKSLVMTFTNAGGKKVNYTLNNVKEGITNEEVTSAMNTILTKNIFSTNSGDLKTIDSAEITDKNITQLSVK